MPPNTTIAITDAMITKVPITSFLVIVVPTITLASTKFTMRAKLPNGATHFCSAEYDKLIVFVNFLHDLKRIMFHTCVLR
jgi:hypothetical protein